MRILIPADVVDRELPVKSFAGGIDSMMVWNPCVTDVQQVAFAPRIRPERNDSVFPYLRSSSQSRTAEQQRDPGTFLLAPRRFTFPHVWQRP
jgi:hypothetical protein